MANENEQDPQAVAPADPTPYRVIQKGRTVNVPVTDYESLVTHHPGANADARVVDGVVTGGQAGRRHAVIDGEIQEIEVRTARRDYGLTENQVLEKRDFILEDPRLATGPASRGVDVPSPLAGYVGRVSPTEGLVDIYDREGGEVIARVRHMSNIAVTEGDTIQYGQALGTQSNVATVPIHVHMEVDTRYHQQFDNYVDDLASGRLALDPPRRGQGIEARAVVDDGIIRIGETDDRVRAAAQQLNAAGLRGADGQPLAEDGVYRLSMQAAVINYQNAQGLPATGNLDPATLQRLVPPTQTQDAPAPAAPAPGTQPAAPQGAQPAPPPGNRGSAPGSLGSNDPLLPQAEAATRRLDASLGREYDGNSACMAASAACLARKQGLTGIDHIVLSAANAQGVAAGQNLIVVQGDLQNPGRQLASMRTDDAVRTPVADSVAQLNRLYEASQSTPSQDANAQSRQTGRTA